jgi:hypothetical protein
MTAMGATTKLDDLKHAWFAYGVFAALLELLRDGVDSQSLTAAAVRIGVTIAFAWWFTKQLRDRSSLAWAFGVVFGLLGALGAALEIIETFHDEYFELSRFLLAAGSGYIHVRMFRVLRDPEVKRHVMAD